MLKLVYFLRNLQTSRVNNLRILRIKNAKSLGYCFYTDTNIWRNFQICISVPLTLIRVGFSGVRFASGAFLDLEFWQFSFTKDWPEILKSEIFPPEFYPISGDWDKLGIQNLARMSLIKTYWMLQNPRVTSFTISELLRENQQGRVKLSLHPD